MADMRHQFRYRVEVEANLDLRSWLAKSYHLQQGLNINIALPVVLSAPLKTILCTMYRYQMTAAHTTSMLRAKGEK